MSNFLCWLGIHDWKFIKEFEAVYTRMYWRGNGKDEVECIAAQYACARCGKRKVEVM